jgi:fluoroacetyl-CoA thioesterase
MRPIELGATGTFALTVAPQHLASQFKDLSLPPVLATPVMIMIMENAAYNAVRGCLEPGESVVGTVVNVRHLAATPLGSRVTGHAEVTRVEGRRIEFKVSARDEDGEIGVGLHERVVVDLEQMDRRLASKRAARRAAAASHG